MKTIGLLGGSFNPVHVGHILVAGYLSQCGPVDEVWFVLSPLNPLKSKDSKTIADECQRLRMLDIAVSSCGISNLKVCDIELSFPRPSYTIDTLAKLSLLYPDNTFKWIIGSDNLLSFSNWKEADEIIEKYGLLVYPRPGYPIPETLPAQIQVVDAPIIEVSGSTIRDLIEKGKNVSYFLNPDVNRFIILNGLYK